MNLSAILVVGAVDGVPDLIDRLQGEEGIDVHHVDPATGRIIVTQEAPDVAAEVAGLKRLQTLPGVALAEMVYHHFEEDRQMFEGLPDELTREHGAACVPPFLNK